MLAKVPADFKVSDVAARWGPRFWVVDRMVGMQKMLITCAGRLTPPLPEDWLAMGIHIRPYTPKNIVHEARVSRTVLVHYLRDIPPTLAEALLCLHGMGFPAKDLFSVAVSAPDLPNPKPNVPHTIFVTMHSHEAAKALVPSRWSGGEDPFLPRWDGHFCTQTKAYVHVLQLQKERKIRVTTETPYLWLSSKHVRVGAVTLADEAKRVFYEQPKAAVEAVLSGDAIPAWIGSSRRAPASPEQSPAKEMPGLVLRVKRAPLELPIELETEVENVDVNADVEEVEVEAEADQEMPDLSIDGSDTTDTSAKKTSKVSRTLPSAEMHHDLVTTTCMPIFRSADVHSYKSDEEASCGITNKCASSDSDGTASSPDSESTVRTQACQTDLTMEQLDKLSKLAQMIKVNL